MHPDIETLLRDNNVKLVAKKDLWYMRLIGKLMFWNDQFMETFWTTIILGPIRVIAFPSSRGPREIAIRRTYTLVHELEHVKDADKPLLGSVYLGNLRFNFKYAFLFFPIIGAYYRLKYEIKAYVAGYRAQIKGERWVVEKKKIDSWVDWVAEGLWKYYLLTCPPFITRKLLKKELADLYSKAI